MINTGAIANLLRPGLKEVFGESPSYPTQYTHIYKTYTSQKDYEQDQEMKMLGLAQIRAEGAATAMDTMGQRYKTIYVHKTIAIGFQITENALEDNLYKDQFPLQSRSLKRSMEQTKEILAASLINNGFNPAYPLGDGEPLLSTKHPIDTGVVPNCPAIPADLNEASLEQAMIAIQQFRDQAGLIQMTSARKLLIPPQLQFVAERLLKSAYSPENANNAVNALANMSMIPDGFTINQFLTNPDGWFVLTDADNGFKHFQRKPYDTDTFKDFMTDNLLAKATERYSFGCSNFRAVYGSGNLLIN
mgnify:CR=1 FL=1